jgi:2-polyprenyl-3-methyl-5-hydroxy-6-metoxy-1,4-benzoquinol methylase
MLNPAYDDSWPEPCKLSYKYDELEVWGDRRDPGYCYQYQLRREWALQRIEALVPKGATILDVAAAAGNFTLPLAEKGYRVTWNDLRSELVEFVKLKYELGEVEFSDGNIFELERVWKNRFDAVLAAEIIEHIAHPDRFLVSVAAMVKPGGHVFLTTPNGAYFRHKNPRFLECADPSVYESIQFKPNSDGHIFLLDSYECRLLAERAGLEVVEIALMTNPLTRGHIKLGHLLPHLPARVVWAVELTTRKLPSPIAARAHCQMVACFRKPND